jgi:2-polyprenyl-6-methoxyphenol hydroxylase-like FAD-dependent oxidoreductase
MTRALIIGGGIAGPTTAMALQRVGLEAVLYEAHPRTTDEVGSYFTVTPTVCTHCAPSALSTPPRQRLPDSQERTLE